MSSRTVGFLDSYDIIGKAIPGVVLLFGLILLLPKATVDVANTNVNVKNLAAIFAASAVSGVVFGEGVHTLARMGERLLAWINRRLTACYRIIYQIASYIEKSIYNRINSEVVSDFSSSLFNTRVIGAALTILSYQFQFTEESELERFRPRAVNNRIRRGTTNVVLRFTDAFVPHRSLFNRFVSERATFTRGEGPSDIRFELFNEAVTEYYNLQADAFRHADNIYPLLSSHLDASSVTRSRRFQGRYSFTRGMWLSTGLLSTLYFGLYCAAYSESIKSGINSTFSGAPWDIFYWFFLLTLFAIPLILLASTFQWFAQKSPNGSVGVFPAWIISAVLTAGGIYLLQAQVYNSTFFFWDLLHDAVYSLLEFGLYISSILKFFLGGIDTTKILAITIFQEALLALTTLLFVSSIAFIIATGSYKRHYVEYTLIDAWESLAGEASTGVSLSIEENTIDDISEILDTYANSGAQKYTRRIDRDRR